MVAGFYSVKIQADEALMSTEALTIDRDAPCVHCAYNLRLVDATRACPECGNPAWDTLRHEFADGAAPGSVLFVQLAVAASIASAPQDAVDFVFTTVDRLYAMELAKRGDLIVATRGTLTPRQICAAVRDEAVHRAGSYEAGRATLGDWQIRSSRDVGRVMAALLRAGLLRHVLPEENADFERLMFFEGIAQEPNIAQPG